jgi:hypothetical protein
MADIRNIMRTRLPNFEKFLGILTASGQHTEPLDVRSFQKGTIYLDTKGHAGAKMSLILQGTVNKGQDRWINLDPRDEDIEVSGDGMKAFTYEAEVSYIRLFWVSGTADEIRVSAFISKTITARK